MGGTRFRKKGSFLFWRIIGDYPKKFPNLVGIGSEEVWLRKNPGKEGLTLLNNWGEGEGLGNWPKGEWLGIAWKVWLKRAV